MSVKMQLITREEFVTTKWSGGLTRQLAIGPAQAVYADRDFLWRVSSATVELATSDFTPLPDYNRYLATIEGAIVLQHGSEDSFVLSPGEIDYFDGGVATVSQGVCTDFNLMLRKDKCSGTMFSLNVGAGEAILLPQMAGKSNKTMVLFCTKGQAKVTDFRTSVLIQKGEALLLENYAKPYIFSTMGTKFMVAEISQS